MYLATGSNKPEVIIRKKIILIKLHSTFVEITTLTKTLWCKKIFKDLMMAGEKNLESLLKNMEPQYQIGDYVFCSVPDIKPVNINDILLFFREQEGITIIIKKEIADNLGFKYSFIAAWISLTVHSSLEAVGLTAAFSKALAANNISCNVVAAFYHDHIFVDKRDVLKAMEILNKFSE